MSVCLIQYAVIARWSSYFIDVYSYVFPKLCSSELWFTLILIVSRVWPGGAGGGDHAAGGQGDGGGQGEGGDHVGAEDGRLAHPRRQTHHPPLLTKEVINFYSSKSSIIDMAAAEKVKKEARLRTTVNLDLWQAGK